MRMYGGHGRTNLTELRVDCACGWGADVLSRTQGKGAFSDHLTDTKPRRLKGSGPESGGKRGIEYLEPTPLHKMGDRA